jgi:uncharacterized protein (DUF433 family)
MSVRSVNDQDLIDQFIKVDPAGGCADARVIGHAVPIWALVGYWMANGRDIDRVARDYDLPTAAVQAALAFYAHHTEVIDNRMRSNIVRIG